ncbi:MAG: hypothetical protein FJX21_13940 [Alphaproteobacteria bacterium]|nr:hypothetical protein [Alphaproteobacteria bacterium]
MARVAGAGLGLEPRLARKRQAEKPAERREVARAGVEPRRLRRQVPAARLAGGDEAGKLERLQRQVPRALAVARTGQPCGDRRLADPCLERDPARGHRGQATQRRARARRGEPEAVAPKPLGGERDVERDVARAAFDARLRAQRAGDAGA